MFKFLILFLMAFSAGPLGAGQWGIKSLQARIKKDRKDILFFMNAIKDLRAQLKKDKAKAAKYSNSKTDPPVVLASPEPPGKPTPTLSKADQWNAQVAQETDEMTSDRSLQEKAQKDLNLANIELSNILSKH